LEESAAIVSDYGEEESSGVGGSRRGGHEQSLFDGRRRCRFSRRVASRKTGDLGGCCGTAEAVPFRISGDDDEARLLVCAKRVCLDGQS
jgi:hypothetical protein